MALSLVSLGSGQNTGTGDSLFAAFTKVNAAISLLNGGGGSFGPGTFNGTANVYALTAVGSSTLNQSLGVLIQGGTSATDFALKVTNQNNTLFFLQLFGDGHGSIGPDNTQGLSWTTAGAMTVNVPTAAVSLTVNGAQSNYAEVINGSGSVGNSYGLQIKSGSGAGDVALLVQNQAASLTFMEIFGDGHGTLGPSATLGLSWTTTGAVSIAAPTGLNTALTATQASSAGYGIVANGNYNGVVLFGALQSATGSGAGSGYFANTGTANSTMELALVDNTGSPYIELVAGTAVQNMYLQQPFGHNAVAIGSLGQVTIAAPTTSAASALTINAIANAYGLAVVAPNTASQSFGLLLRAGTNTTDAVLTIQNAAGTQLIVINGTGGLSMGAPAAGDTITASATPSVGFNINMAAAGGANYLAIANNGTYTLPTGSGMFFIYDDSGTSAAWGFTAFGSVLINVIAVGAYTFSNTLGTAGHFNIAYNGTAYELQNLTGLSHTWVFSMIKLRAAS